MICRNKQELENPYMFSNIEVENIDMELPKQIEINKNESQTTRMPQSSNTNCSNQNNIVGNGVITVSINISL